MLPLSREYTNKVRCCQGTECINWIGKQKCSRMLFYVIMSIVVWRGPMLALYDKRNHSLKTTHA